jgi:hypothetical protein
VSFAPYGPEDLTKQEALRQRVEAAWECTAHPFAEYDPVDVRLERAGRTVAVAELKCHQYRIDAGFYISDHKLPRVRALATGFDVPGFLVAAFNDGHAYWVPVAEVRAVRIDWRARRDFYGNPEPAEWVAYLDWDPWQLLEE